MGGKFGFSKLKGDLDYPIWAMRAESYLICEGLIESLDDIVSTQSLLEGQGTQYLPMPPTDPKLDIKGLATLRLIVEDGPLSQIRNSKTLGNAWVTLKTVYDRGVFTLVDKFLNLQYCTGKMSKFLSEIRYIATALEMKEVKLPLIIINSWLLSKLPPSFEGFKAAVYNSMRTQEKPFSLETLSSMVLNEAKRQGAAAASAKKASQPSYKGKGDASSSEEERAYLTKVKQEWRKAKGRSCTHCRRPGHKASSCFILYPALKPVKPVKVEKKKAGKKEERRSTRDEREEAQVALSVAVDQLTADVRALREVNW